MNRLIYIVSLILLLAVTPIRANEAQTDSLSAERLQQYTYYNYAALTAMELKHYDDVWALTEFAHYLNPENATTLHLKGLLAQALGLKEEGTAMIKAAYEADPIHYWKRYAILLYNQGDKKEATRVVEKACELDPTNVEPLNILKDIYEDQHKYLNIVGVIERLEKLEGVSTATTLAKFRCYLNANKQTKGEAMLQRYLKDNPDDQYAWLALANSLLKRGKDKQALPIFATIFERFPDYGSAYSFMAYYHLQKGDTLRAKQLFRQELDCNDEDVEDMMGTIDELVSLGDSTQLLSYYRHLQQRFPDVSEPYVCLMKEYMRLDSLTQAREAVESLLVLDSTSEANWAYMLQIVAMDTTLSHATQRSIYHRSYLAQPNDPHTIILYAHALSEDSVYAEATNVLHQAIDKTTNRGHLFRFYVALGDTYSQCQQWDSCFAAYDKALEIDPQNSYVLNNYAWHLATQGGDLKRAERMSQRAVQANPQDYNYLDTYGWILHLQGQDTLAAYYLQRTIKLCQEQGEDASHYQQHLDEITQTDK